MVLHILSSATHSVKFVEFMEKYFDLSNHKFVYVRPDICKYGLSEFECVEHINNVWKQIKLIGLMNYASKVILHGLWRHEVIGLLYFQPWILKKAYWVLWGGDFVLGKKYYSKKHNFIIRNIGYFVSIAGDYKYVKSEYNAKGEPMFMHSFYPANIFCGDLCIANHSNKTIILVGNSGDPLNNHIEILQKLSIYRDRDIEIICPLSYCGTEEYIGSVVDYGKKTFGDKFKPLLKFIAVEDYLKKLEMVDIAIFAHRVQQAYGNIIQLAGMGKKIYMRKTTAYDELIQNKIMIFDYDENISLDKIDNKIAKNNYENIKVAFSLKNTLQDFSLLFNQLPKDN